MHNTYVTSSYTLRTRWSVPYSSTDYTICSNERHPFAYSSTRTPCCCSCCATSMYRAPIISPSYCYNLYGYGQSSLIQRSPCRNVCLGGFDRCYYPSVSVCDVNRRCFVDKGCNFREKSVGGKRGRLRKVMVFEERDDCYDLGDVDEAEILLSLLSDDVDEECVYVKRDRKRLVKKPIVEKRENGEECLYVKRDSKRLVKKPMVEKRENSGSCSECGSRKKRVDLGVLENDVSREYKSVGPSSRKGADRRRVEIIQQEDEEEASLRKENRKTRINEEREAILRKVNQRAEEKQEQETLLRKKNWEARAREEEREELLRREEHRPKVTRADSSCSSYYSVSSTGDYASDNDIEHRDERYAGESSSGYKDNTRRNEIVYQGARKEDQRHEGYRVDHQVGLTKKSTAQESRISSSVTESDFRKKSEKKLTDVSIEEMESRKGNMQKESELSVAHGSGYGKSSSSYMKLDDRKLKSTGSAHLDVAKQLHRQTGEEVSRQSETKMKYKQLSEVTDDDRSEAKTSYGSKRMYSGKDDMSATVISSSQEAATEHLTSVGLTTRDDEYHKNSQKVSEVSNIVDIDVRKTSTSQKKFESSDKKTEDYSTNALSSVYDAKRQQHHDKVSVQSQQLTKKGSTSTSKRQSDRELGKQEENVNLVYGSSHYDQVSGRSQQLTEKESTFSKRQSDRNLMKHEENANLVYGSTQGSEERISQSHVNYIRTEDSRIESNELTSVSISNSHSSAIVVDGQNKTSSTTLVRPPYSRLGTSAAEHDESTSGSTKENVTDESLQFGSSKSHERHLERSTAMHHEEYGRVQSDAGDIMFKAHEDALESADRFQKSSAHYVGEFVDQVRHETMSSEIQKEKKTFETKLVHEEKDDQKRLSQYSTGESSSKEHDRRHGSQGSVIKGPSDEVWKVDEPLVPEPSEAELQEDGKNASKVIVKRTGRSLWNVIADVFRLQWSPRSESHSASGKTGGRSSPNQSTSSETWFSGHEAEENKETTEEIEKSITQEQKTHSQLKESSSSSTSEGYLEHVGTNAPSSSVVSESGVPSAEETSRINLAGPSNAAPVVVESSVSVPALRLQRSPIVRSNLQTGEENVSSSSMSEQLNNESLQQSELVIIQGEQKGRRLQRKDQMVKDQFDEWEEAYKLEAEQRKLDEMFMREALLEARKAAECWEVPVGAVLVHKGKIIARGWNLVEETRDSTAHAEMICIREASKILRTWRLSETTLYVTLEPCPMCAGAILQARIDCVVWGAPNKLLGADGSWIRLFPSGDGGNVLEQNDKPAAPIHPFHPKIAIRRNVLASECADAMQQFFQLRRKKKDKKPQPPSPPSCLPIPHHQPKFLTKMQGAFHIMFHS